MIGQVAICCEPQIKPSLTNQAIAGIYRMDQVRNVLADALDALVDKDWNQRIIEEENQKYAGED